MCKPAAIFENEKDMKKFQESFVNLGFGACSGCSHVLKDENGDYYSYTKINPILRSTQDSALLKAWIDSFPKEVNISGPVSLR